MLNVILTNLNIRTGFKATNGEYLYEGDIVEMPLGIKTTIGRIVFEHFGFMVYERTGGVMQFVQRQYKYLGNYHKNKDILNNPVKFDNSKGH